ncbi:MAG: hypothetical protein AB7H97_17450 [Pseudobdellovibrionaceae bacterium]
MRIYSGFLPFLLFCVFATVACTRGKSSSQIKISIPQIQSSEALNYSPIVNSKSLSSQSNGTSFNSLLNPTALNEINCYAVFVGGPGYDAGGSCTVSDGTSFKLGAFAGGVVGGSTIELLVPQGPDRNIVLVGFKTDDISNCKDFHQGMPQAALSEPFVLARRNMPLNSGVANIELTPTSMTSKITNCNFANDNGAPEGSYFGSGSDGDLITSSIINLKNNMNSLSQFYMSTSNVNTITDNGNGTADITVDSSWNSSTLSHVRVGNEVMLYVIGGSDSPNGCDSLWPGFSISGIVTMAQTGGTGNTFRMQIGDDRWLKIPPANLNISASGNPPPTHCRIVATRVPHFNSIVVSSGNLTLKTSSVGIADMSAIDNSSVGLLPVRVKSLLQVDSGYSLSVNVDAGGYKGGDSSNVRGHSPWGQWTGYVSPASSNWSGGGYEAGKGCGGGHGGAGGCSSTSTYSGSVIGDQYGCNTYDATMSCLRGKFFLGGGGAGDGSLGGAGGGAIRLYAKNSVINGDLILSAKGGNASAMDDAGGAGGSIFAILEAISGTGNLYTYASGGNGFGVSSGGVGGGGRIHVVSKSASTFTGSKTASVSFGATGESVGASSGTCIASGVTISGCTTVP